MISAAQAELIAKASKNHGQIRTLLAFWEGDTVAAILGGIIGAGVGREGIPVDWLSELKDGPRSVPWLQNVARELAFADLVGVPRPAPWVFPPRVPVRNVLFIVRVLAHGFRRLLPPYGQCL